MNTQGKRAGAIWIAEAEDVTEKVENKCKLNENVFVIFQFICY